MRTYDTCTASEIQSFVVGRSALAADAQEVAAREELTKEHNAKLAEIDADQSLDAKAKVQAVADENKAYNAAMNESSQEILHITLTGGEKRSVLRSDILFAPLVLTREQKEYPTYAQKPSDKPTKAADAETVYPIVGDWFVEDYDIMTDKFVQKIYDAVTFARYFKASLT